jgi:hypothetical protein
MRFLVDASLPRSAAPMLRQLSHDAFDVRDIGMRGATDDFIAAYARTNRLTLVTRDSDFGDIATTLLPTTPVSSSCDLPTTRRPPRWWRSSNPSPDGRTGFDQLSGRLAIVEPWRVRFRPA